MMTHKVLENQIRGHREKGMALIVALLAITVLTGIGFALILSSSTESLIHGNFRQSGLALYAARAGVEEARGRMGPDLGLATQPAPPLKICGFAEPPGPLPTGCPTTSPDTHIPNATTGLYIRLNTSITPRASCTYIGVDCTDPDAAGDGLTTITYLPTVQTGTLIPYVWVKITLATQFKLNRNLLDPGNLTSPDNTQIVYRKGKSLSLVAGNPPNPVYIMTALAIEPGGARRIVREVGAKGKLPGLPGPLTLDGIPGVYIPPTSNPFTLSGCDGATTPNPPCNEPQDVPSVIVPTAPDVAAAQDLIPDGPPAGANRNTNYPGRTNNGCQGSNCIPVSSASVAAANDPLIFPVNPLTSDDYFKDCAGVQLLRDYISAFADYTYNGNQNSLSTPGSFNNSNAIVNVINGNASLAATDMRPSPSDRGFGVILVTGNLTISGTSDYNGIIIVLGGTMFISGGGGGIIRGGIFVANTTTCPGTLGPVTFDPSGGGNFTIQYDS
ncbi:MAG: pilus assembly PilX N-terminal domain-containing protein, partial [Acidobacteria bacterium]|nr:pilus assembly PilX N-terminal domain-containing protein [Acidobacteriota bacterium]